jgi:hypothetical protein
VTDVPPSDEVKAEGASRLANEQMAYDQAVERLMNAHPDEYLRLVVEEEGLPQNDRAMDRLMHAHSEEYRLLLNEALGLPPDNTEF